MTKSSKWMAFVVPALLAVSTMLAVFVFKPPATPNWTTPLREEASLSDTNHPNPPPSRPSLEKTPPFSFVSYNLRNWLVSKTTPEKSLESKAAVIRILTQAAPDIIGLCEIGSTENLREIQLLLTNQGLDLPHTHHTGGADPVRHLALLSKFPITETHQPKSLILTVSSKNHNVRRGLLDVTLDINGASVRCIGLHLKSKRSIPEFDENLLRIEEARLARKHIDSILTRDPQARLIVYGDWNDHARSTSTRTLIGETNSPGHLSIIPLNDSRGETWTHFWKFQDSYTRIDFIATSRALRSSIDRENSRIIDSPDWENASDHRALLVHFK